MYMLAIKVMLAFTNILFSEGIARLFGDDEKFTLCILKDKKEPLKAIDAEKPDVILLDIITLYNNLSDIKPNKQMAFILVDTDCGDKNIIHAFNSHRLSGVLMSNTTPTLMKKAVMAVAKGEIWMDNKTVKNLLSGVNSLNHNKERLSEREKGVVSLVSLGFRNKEIAQKLNISEPTVKTHLCRIFQKLNILNRHQLVIFALKNQSASGRLFGNNTAKSK